MSLEEIERRVDSLIQAETITQLKSAVWKERLEGNVCFLDHFPSGEVIDCVLISILQCLINPLMCVLCKMVIYCDQHLNIYGCIVGLLIARGKFIGLSMRLMKTLILRSDCTQFFLKF